MSGPAPADTHRGKGRPATQPASAVVRPQHPAPARNPPAQTSDAAPRSVPETPPESTPPSAPGTPDFPLTAGSTPSHPPRCAPAVPLAKSTASPTRGTQSAPHTAPPTARAVPDISLACISN